MPPPNPPINVRVQYSPGNAQGTQWNQTPGASVPAPPGTSTITWTIQVIPASAGTITFNTTTGIQFPNGAPGNDLSGNATQWTLTVNNTLQEGANSVPYYYKVNAVYTPSGGSATNITYDPEVVEDPPNVVV